MESIATKSLNCRGSPKWLGRARRGFWRSKQAEQCMSLIPSMASGGHFWSFRTFPNRVESGWPKLLCILMSCCRCSALSCINLGPCSALTPEGSGSRLWTCKGFCSGWTVSLGSGSVRRILLEESSETLGIVLEELPGSPIASLTIPASGTVQKQLWAILQVGNYGSIVFASTETTLPMFHHKNTCDVLSMDSHGSTERCVLGWDFFRRRPAAISTLTCLNPNYFHVGETLLDFLNKFPFHAEPFTYFRGCLHGALNHLFQFLLSWSCW